MTLVRITFNPPPAAWATGWQLSADKCLPFALACAKISLRLGDRLLARTKKWRNIMANMSYCRFENTLSDLRDCSYNLDDQLSGHEKAARRALLRLAAEMLENIGVTIDEDELEHGIQTLEIDDEDDNDDNDE